MSEPEEPDDWESEADEPADPFEWLEWEYAT